MKRNYVFLQKKVWFLIPVVILTLITLFHSSCNTKKPSTPATNQVSAQPDSFSMNCLVLDSNTFNFWKSKGWTTPGTTAFNKLLLLQFFSNLATNLNDSMRLVGYPGKNMQTIGSRPSVDLLVDTTCVKLPVTGRVIFANNLLDLEVLDLFNPDGSRKGFDFIRFKPTLNGAKYLVFQIEIVRIGLASKDGGTTNPCPPCQYCNPPSCEIE